MANYLSIFSVPESHIAFMAEHKDISKQYYSGEQPVFDEEKGSGSLFSKLVAFISGKKEPVVPDWWPSKEIDLADCVDMEINHRNVDLYHAVLNKTMEFVEGSGTIFQSWMTNEHSAVTLDSSGYEDFAFYPSQLPPLLSLVKAITHESACEAYAEWCKSEENGFEPDLDDATELYEEFLTFEKYLEVTIEKGRGLVWLST